MSVYYRFLKYIDRHEICNTFPDIWEAVGDDFDEYLCQLVIEMDWKKTSRSVWIASHRYAMLPYVDVALAKEVVNKASDDPVEVSLVEPLFRSRMGAALFKSEGAKVQFQGFIETVRKRIVDVEMDDVTEVGLGGLKQAMGLHVKEVVRNGHTLWMKKNMWPR